MSEAAITGYNGCIPVSSYLAPSTAVGAGADLNVSVTHRPSVFGYLSQYHVGKSTIYTSDVSHYDTYIYKDVFVEIYELVD